MVGNFCSSLLELDFEEELEGEKPVAELPLEPALELVGEEAQPAKVRTKRGSKVAFFIFVVFLNG